jgi:hypothetical protein
MEILKTISLAGLVSFILAFFDKEHKKYNENKEKYFQEFLLYFYQEFRSNNNVDHETFIKKYHSFDKIYIPRYVNLLIENKEYEKLTKVLLTDYVNLFPNKLNGFFIALENLEAAFNYIVAVIFMIALSLLPLYLFGSINQPQFWEALAVCLLYFFVFFILLKIILSDDMYSFNDKNINRFINIRIIEYENTNLFLRIPAINKIYNSLLYPKKHKRV